MKAILEEAIYTKIIRRSAQISFLIKFFSLSEKAYLCKEILTTLFRKLFFVTGNS